MAYVLRNVLNGDRQAHDHGDAPVEPARPTTRHYLGRRVTGLWRPGGHRQGGVRMKGRPPCRGCSCTSTRGGRAAWKRIPLAGGQPLDRKSGGGGKRGE